MPRGGARPGAGRPVGAATKRTREAADKAAATGMLPHDFLLAVVRGEVIDGHAPTFDERLTAAKAAAPYFAPRLAAVEMKAEFSRTAAELSDAELYAIIAGTPEGKAVIAEREPSPLDGLDVPEWVKLGSKIKQ